MGHLNQSLVHAYWYWNDWNDLEVKWSLGVSLGVKWSLDVKWCLELWLLLFDHPSGLRGSKQ